MSKLKDLSGKRFGRLTVVNRLENRGKHVRWSCVCDCGNSSATTSTSLVSGHTQSCGCLHREMVVKMASTLHTTHGMSKSAEYKAWVAMKKRCYYYGDINYPNYGGRGITVCDRWLESFENFYADMRSRPSPKHSIDRIDNNGNYEHSNCRWATQKEQAWNKRSNIMINGLCLKEYCRIHDINYEDALRKSIKVKLRAAKESSYSYSLAVDKLLNMFR